MPQLTLSAQPIDDRGRIGFEDRGSLDVTGDGVHETLRLMADELIAIDYLRISTAWDFTLEKVGAS